MHIRQKRNAIRLCILDFYKANIMLHCCYAKSPGSYDFQAVEREQQRHNKTRAITAKHKTADVNKTTKPKAAESVMAFLHGLSGSFTLWISKDALTNGS